MADKFKNKKQQLTINQEMELFIKFLRQDKSITEVNYDNNSVTYRSGSALIEVEFKIGKE